MDTICVICNESHFIPKGNICLRCVQKQKHRKDVEEFIEKNAVKKETIPDVIPLIDINSF